MNFQPFINQFSFLKHNKKNVINKRNFTLIHLIIHLNLVTLINMSAT